MLRRGPERNILAASRGQRVARSQRVWVDMDSWAILPQLLRAREESPEVGTAGHPEGGPGGSGPLTFRPD
jgi:hypothetical protein